MWADFYLIIHELILLYIWGWILYGSHEEDKQVCGPMIKSDKCQASNEDKYWGYFAKTNSVSPINVETWLKINGS